LACILALKGMRDDSALMVIPGIVIGIISISELFILSIRGYPYFQGLVISIIFIIPLISMIKIVKGAFK
jgi:hypothetical protein